MAGGGQVGHCVQDPLMDGCGVYYPYSNTFCDDRGGSSTPLLECGGRDCRGSAYGPGAACFRSSLVLNGFSGQRAG